MDYVEKNMESFEKRIDRSSDCWIWTGARHSDGYGAFFVYFPGGKGTVRAHRFAYEAFVAPIPKGLLVMHKCDNPLCVNPAHLMLGTSQENTNDMIAKGRAKKPGSYCGKNGKWKRGKDHWRCTISDDEVREIRRERLELKWTHQRIAEKHGISTATAHQISTRKRRSNVE